MNKKLLIGGAATILAGYGIYKYINMQNGASKLEGKWTAADIPDLTGKVVIVTGANSGIGFEAIKEFTANGARTIMACRSVEKAEAALAHIQAEIPDASIDIMMLNLASLDSVRQFAADFKAKYDRLDILVNNAGIMMVPFGQTEDGFERQFGVNHLGHFALTGLLIDRLLDTPGARVVTVSSNAHKRGSMDFDHLMAEDSEEYDRSQAYNRSKLANLLFTYELQRRFEAAGADVIAVASHPGVTMTNLATHLMENRFARSLIPVADYILADTDIAALTTLRAAVDPQVQGGDYYGPDGKGEFSGYPVRVQSTAAAHNLADARRLWQVSEKLTGVTFGPLSDSEMTKETEQQGMAN